MPARKTSPRMALLYRRQAEHQGLERARCRRPTSGRPKPQNRISRKSGQAPEELDVDQRQQPRTATIGPAGRGPAAPRPRCARPWPRRAAFSGGAQADQEELPLRPLGERLPQVGRRAGPCPAAADRTTDQQADDHDRGHDRRDPRLPPAAGPEGVGQDGGGHRSPAVVIVGSPPCARSSRRPGPGGRVRTGRPGPRPGRRGRTGPVSVLIASATLVRLGTEMMVASAEFLMRAMKMLPRGWTTVRRAWGMTTGPAPAGTSVPATRPASAWPTATELIPARPSRPRRCPCRRSGR